MAIPFLFTACDNKPKEPAAQADTERSNLSLDSENRGDKDLIITRQLREIILRDPNLSVKAQNIQIETKNGVVILRGMVETINEKNKLDQLAKNGRDVKSVDNQINVQH